MDECTMMMSDPWLLLVTLPAGFATGVAVGLVYFRMVRATADLIVSGGRPILALALALVRLVAVVAVFAGALQLGVPCVVAVLAGVLVGRALTMRQIARAER